MSSAAPIKLVLYIDVVSPWTYVAFTVLQRYKKPWNLDLQIKPINLGYVMKFSENKPPMTVANKGKWMDEDMIRASKFYKVSLKRPSNFPVNTFYAQSLLRIISIESPKDLEVAAQAFFEAVWHDDVAMDSMESIQSILAKKRKNLSFNDSQLTTLIERAISKEERSKLNKESETLAKDDGCFGMPWMVISRGNGDTSHWFGSDRFEQMAAFLGKEYKGPLADSSVAKL